MWSWFLALKSPRLAGSLASFTFSQWVRTELQDIIIPEKLLFKFWILDANRVAQEQVAILSSLSFMGLENGEV